MGTIPFRTGLSRGGPFQIGRATSADIRRSGRPVSVWNDVSRAVIDQCMMSEIKWTLLELQTERDIEKRSFHNILTEDHLRPSIVTSILHEARLTTAFLSLFVITVQPLPSIAVPTYYKCHTSWRTLFYGIII